MYEPKPSKMNSKESENITRPTKLPAFTIAELVVVAALSVITVTIGFAALDLISRQVGDYDREGKEALEYSDLTRLLNRDFLLCREVQIQSGGTLQMKFDSLQISYEQRENFILRSASIPGARIDTFYLQVTDFSATFGGELVRRGWVDRLQIQSLINGIPYEMIFAKTYAAEDFYRRETQR